MNAQVRRRCVFYFAGFDPSGPAHYHRLYAEQAAAQAALQGYQIGVGPRRKTGEHLADWSATFRQPGLTADTVRTDYVFARWDDLVRSHWGTLATIAGLWRMAQMFFATQWFYIRSGAIWRMLQMAWPPVVALLSPLVLVVGAATLWGLAPWLLWLLFSADFFTALASNLLARGGMTALAWLLLGGAMLAGLRKLESKLHMLWLMRSFMFTRKQALGQVPAMDARLREHGSAIAKAIGSGDFDEVLVVGHSSGCVMAASALAYGLSQGLGQGLDYRLNHGLKHGPTESKSSAPTQVAFVTLGHWIPILSSLPVAGDFRAQLAELSNNAALTWVDFSAPADGCCFAFVDPSGQTSPLPAQRACVPKLLSPRFQTLFSKADYRALRKHRFDLHFQYIKAGRLAGDYDYFAITAGAQTLQQRYAAAVSVDDFHAFRLFAGSNRARR